MPAEPQEHPASQHATMRVANEAQPTGFHSSYLNATASSSVSGFVNLNKSGGENKYLDVTPVNASTPSGLHIVPVNASLLSGWSESIEAYFAFVVTLRLMFRLHNGVDGANALLVFSDPINKVCDKLNRCGKRVDDATKQAEALVDNVWNHREFSLHFF